MSRARQLYTIAPNAPFLPLFVDRVLDGTLLNGWDRTTPFWLSDVTIILPTRRARLALAELFATRLGGAALLPDIRTLGGESAEEQPFLPPVDALAAPPEISRLERRLTLSRLVAQFARAADGFATPPNTAEILSLADSLGELIDDLAIEDLSASALDQIVPADLAANWQQIHRFLAIALDAWPQVLAQRGKVDGAAARNLRLRRQAATAAALYGDRPVLAAGSTGSIPATADLLKAIAALPRGAIVLPGLDTTIDPAHHQALLESDNTEGHPQYGLALLLRRLGAGIADVEELATKAPRTLIVRSALALAAETAQWAAQRDAVTPDLARSLVWMSVIATPSADLEARAIALCARAAVHEGKTVGIVSRDQTLARRIAVELSRHGIDVDDPAGTPPFQSAAGRLARQLLAVATSRYAPVDTVALLRNAAVTLGLPRSEVRHAADWLDRLLRGKRTAPGLFGLLAIAQGDDLPALLERLGEALRPLSDLCEKETIDAPAMIAALGAALATTIGPADLPGLAEYRLWSSEIAASGDTGPSFAPRHLDAVLERLMAGAKVQSGERRRDDVHIWGELEARLQNPDLLILAGANEDIWPAPADPGPWMSRGMRIAVGLEPPERQHGQAAHDFEMALGNAHVVIAYAQRIGTAPALPSRFLQRLDAFVGETEAAALRARGAVWVEQAQALDVAGLPQPARRPAPNPPAADRPRRLSITEIEPLIRSPYDIYAKHVLRLKKQEPLGTEPDARDRGNMIHKVFERFVDAGLAFDAPDALAALQRMASEEFAGLDAIGERRDIWLRRFAAAAEQFLAWERERGQIVARVAERKAEWAFPHLDNFVLVGKADRIDMRGDGRLEILDFKTGGVPLPKDMKDFEAPQLLLEAAMARAGIFADVPPADSAELTYLKIGLGPAAFQVRAFSLRKGMSLMQAVDEIERRTQGHVEAFLLRDGLPMAARIKPRDTTGRRPRPGDYDHLARTDEWTLTAGVDDP